MGTKFGAIQRKGKLPNQLCGSGVAGQGDHIGSVRFQTVVGIREIFHEEGGRVEPHRGECRVLHTRSAHTPVGLLSKDTPHESEQPAWDLNGQRGADPLLWLP